MDLNTNTKRILYILNVFVGLAIFSVMYIHLNLLEGPKGPIGHQGALGLQGPITYADPGPTGPIGPTGNPGLPGLIGPRGTSGPRFQFDTTKENITVSYQDVTGAYAYNSFDSIHGTQVNFVFPTDFLTYPYAFTAKMVDTTGAVSIDQTTDQNVQDITFNLPEASRIGATGATGPTGASGSSASSVPGFLPINYIGAPGVNQTVQGPTGPTGVSFGDGLPTDLFNGLFYNGALAYLDKRNNRYVVTNQNNYKFQNMPILTSSTGPQLVANGDIDSTKINFGPSAIFLNGYKSFGGFFFALDTRTRVLPYVTLATFPNSELYGCVTVGASLNFQNFRGIASYDTRLPPPVVGLTNGSSQIVFSNIFNSRNNSNTGIYAGENLMFPVDILPYDPSTGETNTILRRNPGYFFPRARGSPSQGFNSPPNNESVGNPDTETFITFWGNETTTELRFFYQQNRTDIDLGPSACTLYWHLTTANNLPINAN